MSAPKYIPWPEEGDFKRGWWSSDGRCCMMRWLSIAFGHDSRLWHRALDTMQRVLRERFTGVQAKSVGGFDETYETTDRERARVWAITMRRLGYVVDATAGWP